MTLISASAFGISIVLAPKFTVATKLSGAVFLFVVLETNLMAAYTKPRYFFKALVIMYRQLVERYTKFDYYRAKAR